MWLPGASGWSVAIFWARAQLLPPTGSFTASTSLLHVGFPNFSTWRNSRKGGGGGTFAFKQDMTAVMLHVLWVASSRCTKNGGVPSTHCLHMCSNSSRCGCGLRANTWFFRVIRHQSLDSIVVSHVLQWLATPSMVLKPEQRASIKVVYEEKDPFVWLPTGFAVCYEALLFVKLGTNAPCLALVYFTINIIGGPC